MTEKIEEHLDTIKVSLVFQRTKNGGTVMLVSLKPRYMTTDGKVNHPMPMPVGWTPAEINSYLKGEQFASELRAYAEKVKAAPRKGEVASAKQEQQKMEKANAATKAKRKAAPAKKAEAPKEEKPHPHAKLLSLIIACEEQVKAGSKAKAKELWAEVTKEAKEANGVQALPDKAKERLRKLMNEVKNMNSLTLFDS